MHIIGQCLMKLNLFNRCAMGRDQMDAAVVVFSVLFQSVIQFTFNFNLPAPPGYAKATPTYPTKLSPGLLS